MARRAATFTQADITRTIKGVMAAGIPVRVTVDPRAGSIKIEPIAERDKTDDLAEGVSGHKRPIVL